MSNVRRGFGRSKGCITCKKRKIKCGELAGSGGCGVAGTEPAQMKRSHGVADVDPRSWCVKDMKLDSSS